MKAVNSRNIHQLFVHLSFETCAPAISSDTITCLSLRREERYKLAIHDFMLNLTFYHSLSEAYAANLISTGIDKFSLASSHNSEKHKRIEQSALNNLSCKSQRNLGPRQLSCVQAACLSLILSMWEMSYQPSDDNSFSIWNLRISSIQMHKLSIIKDQRGAIQHCLQLAPNVKLEPLRPCDQSLMPYWLS